MGRAGRGGTGQRPGFSGDADLGETLAEERLVRVHFQRALEGGARFGEPPGAGVGVAQHIQQLRPRSAQGGGALEMFHALIELALEVADETQTARHLEDIRERLGHRIEQCRRLGNPGALQVTVGELPPRHRQVRVPGGDGRFVLPKRLVVAGKVATN